MAEIDLQQQMVEAAKERSDIAKALLAIQSTLDKLGPTVARMESVLSSRKPTVNARSAGRPGVDEAVEKLQSDIADVWAQLTKIAHNTAPAPSDKPHVIPELAAPVVCDSGDGVVAIYATGLAAPTPATCSTCGLGHGTGVLELYTGAHTKCSMESSEVGAKSMMLASMSVATRSATATSVLLVDTNSNGLGEELRPLPWPSFVCVQVWTPPSTLSTKGVHTRKAFVVMEDMFSTTHVLSEVSVVKSFELFVNCDSQKSTPERCLSICFGLDMDTLKHMFMPDVHPYPNQSMAFRAAQNYGPSSMAQGNWSYCPATSQNSCSHGWNTNSSGQHLEEMAQFRQVPVPQQIQSESKFSWWESSFGRATQMQWDPGKDNKKFNDLIPACWRTLSTNAVLKLTNGKPIQPASILSVQQGKLQKVHIQQWHLLLLATLKDEWKSGLYMGMKMLIASGTFIQDDVLAVRIQFHVFTCCVRQQSYCRMLSRLISHGIHFLWDPSIAKFRALTLDIFVIPCQVLPIQKIPELLSLILQTQSHFDLQQDSVHLTVREMSEQSPYLDMQPNGGQQFSCPEILTCCLYGSSFKKKKEMASLIPELCNSRFNAMHYCQIFQKCNPTSSQHYSQQDMNLCEIALWLINFQPPFDGIFDPLFCFAATNEQGTIAAIRRIQLPWDPGDSLTPVDMNHLVTMSRRTVVHALHLCLPWDLSA